ncbi:hypothetical protein [Haladaptatus sp. NG-WS-4]
MLALCRRFVDDELRNRQRPLERPSLEGLTDGLLGRLGEGTTDVEFLQEFPAGLLGSGAAAEAGDTGTDSACRCERLENCASNRIFRRLVVLFLSKHHINPPDA